MKITDPAKRMGLVLVGVAAALTCAGGAGAQRWESHISASWVREIVASEGRIVMATSGGVVVYDPATGGFTQYTNVDGLPSNDVSCLAFDARGDIYVGTRDIGIARVRLDGGKLTVLRRFNQQIDGLADNEVNSVAVWGDVVVYGTSGGAGTIVNSFPAALYRVIEGMPSDVVGDVHPVGDRVVMATDGGVVVLDDLGLLNLPSGGPPEANVIGSDGALVYVGTDDGIWTLDPADSTWTQIGPSGGRVIYSLYYDGQVLRAGDTGNLWTRDGAGWIQTSLAPVHSEYSLPQSLSQLRGLAVGDDGAVYLGSGAPVRQRGLNLVRWNGSDLENLVPDAPGANDIRRVSADVDGSVWASFAGFWVGKLGEDNAWVNYNSTIPASDSLSRAFNLVCLADADGSKWFGTIALDAGDPPPLDRLDDALDGDYANDEWEHIAVGTGGGDGLGSPSLQNAALDPAGNRWFFSNAGPSAGWEGVQILSRDRTSWLQVKTTTAGADLADANVIDAAFDDFDAYVALYDWGVQRWRHWGYDWTSLSNLSNDSWEDFWPLDIDAGNVSSVAVTDDGKVWVGTDNGVYRVDSNLLPGSAGRVRRFGVFSGFGAGLVSLTVRDLLVDREGDVWVATAAGLNRISGQDENVIDAWSTAAEYQRSLSQLQYPFDVISPLVNENCHFLALHPEDPVLYIATGGGLSVFEYPESPPPPQPLARAYVYPNPVDASRGHSELFIENVTDPVVVEVYNVEGELVHSTPAGETLQAGDSVWDLTDQSGFLVASGVYFVRIVSTAGGGSVVKPVTLIR